MKHLSFVFVVFILFAVACKKEKDDIVPAEIPTATVPEVLDFTYTGNLLTGSEITFTADVPASYSDNQITWQMDDGYLRPYTGRTVKNTFFSEDGNRLVTMKIIRNGNTDTAISKKVYIKFDTTGMSGMRHWKGSSSGLKSGGSYVDTLEFDEMVYADDSTVRFWNKAFIHHYTFPGNDTLGKSVRFRSVNYNKNYDEVLDYYYARDSFEYHLITPTSGIMLRSSKK